MEFLEFVSAGSGPWVGLWQLQVCLGANSGIHGLGAPCWAGRWCLQPAFLLSDPQDQRAGSGSLQSLGGSASFPLQEPFQSRLLWGRPLPPCRSCMPNTRSNMYQPPDVNVTLDSSRAHNTGHPAGHRSHPALVPSEPRVLRCPRQTPHPSPPTLACLLTRGPAS